MVFLGLLVDRELLGLGVATDVAGATAWTLPLFLTGDLALLWRRTQPVASAVVVFMPYALHAVITDRGVEGAFVLLPALVSLYSLGAYAAGRPLIGGIAAVVVLNALHDSHDPGIHLSDQVEAWSYLFFVSVAAGVLVVGVLVGTRRRAREHQRETAAAEARREEAVASERAKIARELHDVVTHNVNVVVMQAMAAHGVLDTDPDRARAPLDAIESSGREALSEMRRMLGVLREETEPMLSPQPGATDVRRLVSQVRQAGQPVTLEESGDLEGLPDGMGMVLFRIAQESLTNAMKHATGAAVQVRITRGPTDVLLEVTNDPGGRPEPTPTGAGHGLVGMAERAGLFGGTATAGPRADGGFAVTARLPLESA